MIEFKKVGPAKPAGHAATFALEDGYTLRVAILSGDLARVSLVPAAGWPVDRTWMVAPGGDVPHEGRSRAGDEGFEIIVLGADRLARGRCVPAFARHGGGSLGRGAAIVVLVDVAEIGIELTFDRLRVGIEAGLQPVRAFLDEVAGAVRPFIWLG